MVDHRVVGEIGLDDFFYEAVRVAVLLVLFLFLDYDVEWAECLLVELTDKVFVVVDLEKVVEVFVGVVVGSDVYDVVVFGVAVAE